MKKKVYNSLSKLTAAIHFMIVLLYVACIVILFTSKELRIYAAILFALIWILQKVFKGCCLTQAEDHLKKKACINKCENPFFFNRFAHCFFNKTFNISSKNVDRMSRALYFVLFIASMVIIIGYFK